MPPPPAPPRLSIAVVGLGGIGAALAMSLRAADRHDVIACARRPTGHLVLERAEGTVDLPLRAVTTPAEADQADWVMLCTKAHHTPSTAPWLARLCGPRTRVAVLQNGIGHVARVAPYAGGATIVPTVVYYNGERLADDRVRLRHVVAHDLVAANDAAGRDFAQVLDGSNLSVLLSDDFATLAWRKLLLNVVVNPVTALTLQRQAALRHDAVHALCLEILDEAVTVARADGARLDGDEAARIMATLLSYSPELGTSMYFDRLAGRSLEIEALTGAIVTAAERHGIRVPVNRTLLALLRAVSDAASA
ncbi:MAG TPA: 2-dehydropantoate 2-reductase [Acetobacteraceae bacterium]|nr:2-dehydropantoate 2-reductase [Acetobacteraceae bacterium]